MKTKAPARKSTSANLLTEADVDLLQKREGLKAELKRLDALLNPKVEATLDHIGGTGRYVVGNRQVELSESFRENCSWKELAYSVATEDAINAVKSNFTSTSSVRKAVVVL